VIPPLITREALRDGVLQRMIAAADPTAHILTFDELRASLGATLAAEFGAGGPAGDVWLFAYGSLIWNPAFHFVERRLGIIRGWHRRFCLWTDIGRGTPDNPGLILGLDRGGTCRGVAFRIAAEAVEEELELVWRREMVTESYRPRWVEVRTTDGPLRAVTFTIRRDTSRYAGRLSEAEAARSIATASGRLGGCSEYFFATVDHLDELGIRDHSLVPLRRRVEALCAQASAAATAGA
jgi:glutathione-specific gamma-glutamylcyclotransferase